MIRPIIAPLQFLQEFRHRLLGIFTRRADVLFELMDALFLTLDPRSPTDIPYHHRITPYVRGPSSTCRHHAAVAVHYNALAAVNALGRYTCSQHGGDVVLTRDNGTVTEQPADIGDNTRGERK